MSTVVDAMSYNDKGVTVSFHDSIEGKSRGCFFSWEYSLSFTNKAAFLTAIEGVRQRQVIIEAGLN